MNGCLCERSEAILNHFKQKIAAVAEPVLSLAEGLLRKTTIQVFCRAAQ